MELRTKVHTILMMVGPTECGKTTFAKEVLMPALSRQDKIRNIRTNVQHLSSDAIRQEVLGYEYDKYDHVMLEASSAAFELLFEKLKRVTSFPINAEFVIIDTTGLAEDFRARVREIAHENNYNIEVILFDYRNRDDYYASERSKKTISNHINRLKREVLGSLAREGYDRIHKVRYKSNAECVVVIEDWDDYVQTTLPRDGQYIVVGDIHERIDDLKSLLLSYGYRIEGAKLVVTDRVKNTKIVLVGDWIDKGKQTAETIRFLYDNQEHFLLVLGNHENFVLKFTMGEVKGVDPELTHTYFDSTQVLLGNPELLEKFRYLVSLSKPFYRFNGLNGPSFFVTHAPCRNKYVGKLDTNSIRHQRNFRIDRSASIEEQLEFVKQEAVNNHPYHIFGHIAAKMAFRIKNKLHIDTGSVHGNSLTSVSISYKPFYKSVKSKETIIAEELPTLFQEERKVSLEDLSEDDIRRLQYCSRHKVNFISGTMSPADKDEAAHELESLHRGLQYFAERGVSRVVLQPKYMGSRCNLYLHREFEKCFAVSRNGYRIQQVDLTEIYAGLQLKFGDYMEAHDVEMLIIDGELLPWKAIGDSLIQRQFKPIEKALESELAYLRQNGFEQALGLLVEQYQSSGFEKDQHHVPKSGLIEKYGDSTYQNYKRVHDILETYVPLTEHVKAYETYNKQMELYAEDAPLEYKPFALLKIVYTNGEEQIPDWNTSDMYRFLSDDPYLIIDLSEDDSCEKANNFFATLTVQKHMEGVVIKPETLERHVVPYMKVRNPEYLSIIYGYDYRFPHKYNKLLKQKNISQKLRTSQNEYQWGKKLLSIKFHEISPDNAHYKDIAANLLFEVSKENEIDPRL